MSDFSKLSDLVSLFHPGMMGPRVGLGGSVSDKGLDEIEDRPVVEFRPEIGALDIARYFRVETPDIGGRLGAVPTADLTPEQLPQVRVRFVEGHGLAFFLDVEPDLENLPPVDFSIVILGPADDEGTLGGWTWFPGGITGTLTIKDQEFTATPANEIGVKLHNGE